MIDETLTASRAIVTDATKKVTSSAVTDTEVGHLSGVTSAIQTQLGAGATNLSTHAALVSGTHGITAAAATVLDDATVGAMVDTLGGASALGTGGLVRGTSPTLTTPTIGVAAATSLIATGSIGAGNGMYLYWNGLAKMQAVSDGAVEFSNWDQSGFTSLSIGPIFSNTPSAVTLKTTSVYAGNLNTASTGHLSIEASAGTGTGTGGSMLFKTAPAGGSGTSVNPQVTAMTIASSGVVTFANTIAGSINGNAATVTTNANLTGEVTSVGNAATISPSIKAMIQLGYLGSVYG